MEEELAKAREEIKTLTFLYENLKSTLKNLELEYNELDDDYRELKYNCVC